MDEYKIAIFHGNNPIDVHHDYQDGEIEIFGDRLGDTYHILEFIEKIKEKYNDVPLLSGVKLSHPAYVPACFFALLEDPVFYNTTPNDKRYGKMGQFYFSNSITPSQKNAILTFAEKISDYQIFIFYDIQIIEGEITWQTKSNMNQKNNAEFMQNFLNQGLIKIKEDNIKKGL